MNMRRQPSRMNHKNIDDDRQQAADHGDLLPWADPYIASLFRQYDRRMRAPAEPKRARRAV